LARNLPVAPTSALRCFPAGLSFARTLKESKLKIALIEKSSLDDLKSPQEDGREIALTHLSVKLMKELGAWDRVEPDSISPIKNAKVLNGDSPYSLDFTRPSKSMEALGYLIPNHLIRKAFYEEVAEKLEQSIEGLVERLK